MAISIVLYDIRIYCRNIHTGFVERDLISFGVLLTWSISYTFWCTLTFCDLVFYYFRYSHSLLADYYLGLWNQTRKKQFVYPHPMAEKLKLVNSVCASLRYTPLQSTEYGHCDGQARFNFRKLNRLPFHLLHAGEK